MNCWWGINLRQKWIDLGCLILWVLVAVFIAVSIYFGLTVASFVGVLAGSLRVMAWGLNEYNNQTAAIKRLRDIYSFADEFRGDSLPSATEIRGVQDAVFDNRQSALPIPDWFYKRYRTRQEREAGGVSES